jgi:hypothetical protein
MASGSQKPKPDSPVEFRTEGSEVNTKLAAAAGELGEDVERATDSRAEERFVWIVVCIILFDCLIFRDMESWTGPLVIGIIQLVLIIALAKKLQVDYVANLLTRFMDRVGDYPDGRGKK